MGSDAVLCKRVFVTNGDASEYVDIYPNHAMIKLSGWRKPRRFEIELRGLYQRLHNGCGVCYLDDKETVSIDLDPLYEDFGTYRERMVMFEFEKINDDNCRARISFKDLVEAIYFWIA